jgi:hypothetical protein
MRRSISGLFLGASLLAPAQVSAQGLKWATEVDLLPVATGGWYTSLAAGRNLWRMRAVAAEVRVPDAFAPEGWEASRTRAQALLADRFFRPGFTGGWIGGGVERWEERLKLENSAARVHLTSLQATMGGGWNFDLGKGFTANPWLAVHHRISGERAAAVEQQVCRPRPWQAEASLKIGYSFN